MCFFAVTGGMVTVVVFYHGHGLHGNYRSFTAVKIARGNPRGKPWIFFGFWFFGFHFEYGFITDQAYSRRQIRTEQSLKFHTS